MSWQAYVDTSLVASGHIEKAAIISAAGDSIWATSSGFSPEMHELKTIVAILAGAENEKADQKAVQTAQAEGIHVAGERYVVARIDGRSIYARKGRIGICIAKTKQAFILARHGEQQTAGNASQTTEALADYLIKAGY
ncbi:putative Profilin [Rosellinia necatrix]|uniref:Profilin n=1 Tax=Rosellinia necatrix TaxID=77044 RepID=A0A1W2TPQ1_ROSNE|nr:putative Profilin [Rosellinia necatrix]